MLASLIKLGFCLDDKKRNLGVVRLGTCGVPFAAHLLGEKLESPANRFVALEVIAELAEMTFESRQFFGDIASLREDRDLCSDPRIKQVNWQSGRLQAGE